MRLGHRPPLRDGRPRATHPRARRRPPCLRPGPVHDESVGRRPPRCRGRREEGPVGARAGRAPRRLGRLHGPEPRGRPRRLRVRALRPHVQGAAGLRRRCRRAPEERRRLRVAVHRRRGRAHAVHEARADRVTRREALREGVRGRGRHRLETAPRRTAGRQRLRARLGDRGQRGPRGPDAEPAARPGGRPLRQGPAHQGRGEHLRTGGPGRAGPYGRRGEVRRSRTVRRRHRGHRPFDLQRPGVAGRHAVRQRLLPPGPLARQRLHDQPQPRHQRHRLPLHQLHRHVRQRLPQRPRVGRGRRALRGGEDVRLLQDGPRPQRHLRRRRGVPSRTHYGNAYVNAFWDGSQMTYGDGQGNQRPLVELDVAGHEMAHGVSGALTGWDETGETGGMNEGTSDIFGTLVEFYANNPVDQPDYTMGELINISGDNQPLRWMNQPSLDGSSPDCWNSNNGGLDPHYSMGPLNHWFFLAAVGSGNHGYGNSPTCNNSTVTGIGNDKAGKIWFKALASYANSRENYHQARIDSLKAAADLYGAHCTEYNTVDAAWAAVSVTGADPVPGTCGSQPGSPSVTNPGNQTTAVGTAVSLQIQASDPGGATLTYSASGLPAGLSVNASTGRVTGTPTTAGTSSVTVTAKNTAGATGSAAFTWTVNGDGTPPGGCGDLPAWSATTPYAPGDRVAYNGRTYTSQWYSTGAEPGAPGSWAVWTDGGAC
ncbi:M4 family metallopeptidase [Streptomyces sp. NPDC086838]|uniref:M4 family metallopeptidase n=1 Tax=Streptomyces sp. NPDC086838 TaxID=3365762 RepID=UPI00381D4E2F